MRIQTTEIEGVLLVEPVRHGDDRGYFSETYREAALREAGFGAPFVQDNESFSAARNTVRGLHFQIGADAQDKLVRAIRGSILDVAVDIRRESPTFGRHVAIELSAQNGRQLLVPRGCAHGFQTLSEDCLVAYKVSAYYAPQAERGLLWCDPALGLPWTCAPETAVVNKRDTLWPALADLDPADLA